MIKKTTTNIRREVWLLCFLVREVYYYLLSQSFISSMSSSNMSSLQQRHRRSSRVLGKVVKMRHFKILAVFFLSCALIMMYYFTSSSALSYQQTLDMIKSEYIKATAQAEVEVEVDMSTTADEKKNSTDSTYNHDDTVNNALQSSTVEKVTLDLRKKTIRPFMTTVSHSFLDSIYAIERKYDTEPRCKMWGGSQYIETLQHSSLSLLKEEQEKTKSSIVSFHHDNTNFYYAQNVSIVLEKDIKSTEWNQSLLLEIDGEFVNEEAQSRMVHNGRETVLGIMTQNVKVTPTSCREEDYIDYPVMLVDNKVDSWNWWFFLKTVFHHYIVMVIMQQYIKGDYTSEGMRVLHTMEAKKYSRSFVDAYDFFFSDDRARDSRQVWNVPELGQTFLMDDGETTKKRMCFRKLIWAPGASTSIDEILVNRSHSYSDCFSSLIYSYAAQLKASLHIPALPRPEKPTVVWVGRDTSKAANPTSWQARRIIENQDDVINHLSSECEKLGVELIVADFYGDKKETPYQEQAFFVSRANIMIGMHGKSLK